MDEWENAVWGRWLYSGYYARSGSWYGTEISSPAIKKKRRRRDSSPRPKDARKRLKNKRKAARKAAKRGRR